MPFDMPTAERARLNELLNVLGDRAEDFRKCFDTESEWCWKYADLMLRGMQQRELEYAERHHIVPVCFYGKRNSAVNDGNLTTLTYGEHLYAHYCAALCGIGKMKGKMAIALHLMYYVGKKIKIMMLNEDDLHYIISGLEEKKIRSMETGVNRVNAQGRTHCWEDPKQYRKDYYKVNKEQIIERWKSYYDSNREKILEHAKAYYDSNREKLLEQKKAYGEANREKIKEKNKSYREANKEQLSIKSKSYYEANKEKIYEYQKSYREANKEQLSIKNKAYREANKERLSIKNKAYKEANKEQLSIKNKAYWEANKEQLSIKNKAYREANKERLSIKYKAYREANKEKRLEQTKAYYESKKAAGYRYRKDPVTGKRHWVFVGLPGTPESLCA